jgi:hypothetical protein
MLGMSQLGSPGGSSKGDEIVGDHRYSASRALLPWSVCGRIDDDLPDDSPSGVMRVAACDQKPRERIGDPLGLRIGRVKIEMPQRGTDVATSIHRFCQTPCRWPRPASRIVDQSTIPAAESTRSSGKRRALRRTCVGRQKALPFDRTSTAAMEATVLVGIQNNARLRKSCGRSASRDEANNHHWCRGWNRPIGCPTSPAARSPRRSLNGRRSSNPGSASPALRDRPGGPRRRLDHRCVDG